MSQQASPHTWWLNPWWLGAVLALLAITAYAVLSTVLSVVFFEPPSFDGYEFAAKNASSMRWSMVTDLWPINLLALVLAAASAWTLVSAYRRLPDFPWRLVAIRGAILFIPVGLAFALVTFGLMMLMFEGEGIALSWH